MNFIYVPTELIGTHVSLIEGVTTLHRGDETYSFLYRGMVDSEHAFEKVLTKTGE